MLRSDRALRLVRRRRNEKKKEMVQWTKKRAGAGSLAVCFEVDDTRQHLQAAGSRQQVAEEQLTPVQMKGQADKRKLRTVGCRVVDRTTCRQQAAQNKHVWHQSIAVPSTFNVQLNVSPIATRGESSRRAAGQLACLAATGGYYASVLGVPARVGLSGSSTSASHTKLG